MHRIFCFYLVVVLAIYFQTSLESWKSNHTRVNDQSKSVPFLMVQEWQVQLIYLAQITNQIERLSLDSTLQIKHLIARHTIITNSSSEVGELAKTSHHKIVASIYAVFDEVQPPASPIWIDVENNCNRHHHNRVTYTEIDVEKLHVYETIISLVIIMQWLRRHCFLTTIVLQWRLTQERISFVTAFIEGPKLKFSLGCLTWQVIVRHTKNF